MKHIFLLNPRAGHGSSKEKIRKNIEEAAKNTGVNYEIVLTPFTGSAMDKVFEIALSNPDETFRFYACGGDGTINEVLNGAMKVTNAEVAVLPCGSGNDFTKSFTNTEYFHDIEKVINGKSVAIDCIKCNDRYAFNMVNIGFDCDVVAKTEFIRTHTIFKGGAAYKFGVFTTLFAHYGKYMKITMPDGEVKEGKYLLSAVANGHYCGGGFHSHPYACLTDGLLDACIINKVSRFKFISLLSSYAKGLHVTNKRARKSLEYYQLPSIRFDFNEETGLCYDGEIVYSDHAIFSIEPKAVKFAVPDGCDFLQPMEKQ